jgi:hypothetical protein
MIEYSICPTKNRYIQNCTTCPREKKKSFFRLISVSSVELEITKDKIQSTRAGYPPENFFPFFICGTLNNFFVSPPLDFGRPSLFSVCVYYGTRGINGLDTFSTTSAIHGGGR